MSFFRKLTIYVLLFGGIISSAVGETSLDDILPVSITPEERLTLLEESYIYRYDKDFQGILYAPDVPAASGLDEAFAALEPQVLIEVLTLMPKMRNVSPEEYLLLAYNRFRQVSSISGVRYVSAHDGEDKELFSDVYRVVAPGSRQPLPDELVDRIPESEGFTVHMKEANMGRGYYAFEYAFDGSDIALAIRNLSTMRMIIKVLEPGGLEFRFLFVPVEEQVLLYVSCAVHMENERAVRRMLTPWGYFHNRIKILYGWLYRGLLGADAVPPIPD